MNDFTPEKIAKMFTLDELMERAESLCGWVFKFYRLTGFLPENTYKFWLTVEEAISYKQL